jgi:hypothetical protein
MESANRGGGWIARSGAIVLEVGFRDRQKETPL